MKKVSELTGAELDYWVAKGASAWKWGHELYPTMTLDPTFNGARVIEYGDGRTECILTPSNPMRQAPKRFNPSENWLIGGIVIQQFRIPICPCIDGSWYAEYSTDDENTYELRGPTPLIAAMRAFVASKYGQEVGE